MQKTNYNNIKKLGLCIVAFEATEHLYNIISELRESVDYVSIGLQRLSYHGDPISEIDYQEVIRLRDEDKIVDNVIFINLKSSDAPRVQETEKRNILIQDAQDHGCTHCICIDSDEYYTRKGFERACAEIDEHDYPITYCQYVNYYHDYNHFLVYPFKDGMHVPFVTRVEYRHSFDCTDFLLPSDPTRRFVRPYNGVKSMQSASGKVIQVKNYTVDYHVFPWSTVKMHHLSWLRADIRKKLNMWSSKTCFDNYNTLIDKAVVAFNNFDENAEHNEALMLFNTPGNKVDVKKFPKQYIHPKVDFNTRLRTVANPKRVAVLTMVPDNFDDETRNKTIKWCDETWQHFNKDAYKCEKVDFYFCEYDDKANKAYVKDNYIYVDKTPTIDVMDNDYSYRSLSKTVKALNALATHSKKYDYIVITNGYTWLNIPLLNIFLSYQEDDSKIFGSRLYSAYWSTFNMYITNDLIILPVRYIDILNDITKDPIALENNIIGVCDNLMFGLLNKRLADMGHPQSMYYHTIGMGQYDGKVTIMADKMCHQALTPEGMPDFDNMYKLHKIFVDMIPTYKPEVIQEYTYEKYNDILLAFYDQYVTVLPLSKEDAMKQGKIEMRKINPLERTQAIELIPKLQEQYKYPVNNI